MSSDSDKFVLEDALTQQDNDVYFNSKKWNYITDVTSNAGVFTNQMQFNLNTFSSQGNWIDLSQAYIQFPIRTRIYNSGSVTQTPSASTVISTVLKNGFWHMIDSVNIVIDNTTIQMNQNFENVNATFKMLTEWDANQFNNLGVTLGLGPLDDVPTSSATSGLNNILISSLVPNERGFDTSDPTINTTIPTRQYEQNINVGLSTTALNSIVGTTNSALIGKSSTQASASAAAVNASCYVQYVLATVRLCDLSDAIKKMPPTKNLKGMVYVNYNGASINFTTTGAGTTNTPIKNWTYSNIQGRTTPVLLQNSSNIGVLGPFSPNVTNLTANTWTLECTVSGQKDSTLTSATPPINYARLIAPLYVANPDIDAALTQSKRVFYLERSINNFTVQPNTSFNGTITSGIVNPKRLILIPYFVGTTALNSQTLNYQPYQSPFEACPATTSLYPVLRNLQVTVGNQTMFMNPVNMDYETFLNEIAACGIDGSQNNMLSSGLLNQRLWSQLYRFYTVDIGRRMISEDGSLKGITCSFDNATTQTIQVFAFVLYEKSFTVETSTCTLTK